MAGEAERVRQSGWAPGSVYEVEWCVLRLVAMRRIQAATLIVALFAVPLALVARGYAGASQECAMSCCRGRHVAAMKMKCAHAAQGQGTQSAMCQCTEHGPDFGLNCPLPPFELGTGVRLPVMNLERAVRGTMTISGSTGYFPPPFNPPRA